MFLAREINLNSADGVEMPKPENPAEFITKAAFLISFTQQHLQGP